MPKRPCNFWTDTIDPKKTPNRTIPAAVAHNIGAAYYFTALDEHPRTYQFRELIGWNCSKRDSPEPNPAKAAAYFRKNLIRYREIHAGENNTDYMRTLLNLARCVGNDEAKKLRTEALKIFYGNRSKISMGDNCLVCDGLVSLAHTYGEEGNEEEKIECWRNAMEVAQTILPTEPDRIKTYGDALIVALKKAGRENEIGAVQRQLAKFHK